MKYAKDLINKKFNRWTFIKRLSNKGTKITYLVRCDCGIEKILTSHHIIGNKSKSCGCLRKELQINKSNHTEHRTHKIWAMMMYRCNSPKYNQYNDYGGRGISVCKEWHDYNNFRGWALNNGYKDNLFLDRINNDGNYEPSNCRFTTRKINMNNRRNTKYLTAFGETKPLTVWATDKRCVVSENKLRGRIWWEWNAEQALTKF